MSGTPSGQSAAPVDAVPRDWPRQADLVVVGGGIVGAACAAVAAERGASVVLVDKEPAVGREGSGRALGAIRVQGRHPAEIPLAREAREVWRREGERGDFELRFSGNLYLVRDEAELPMLESLVAEAREAGFEVRLLDADGTREVVPAATGDVVAAMYSENDGHCQPVKATRHFAGLARDRGVVEVYDTLVTRIVERDGAVAGVVTTRGAIRAPAVVVAGGVWTPHLASTAGVRVPVMPIAYPLAETAPLPPVFSPVLRSPTFSGRQRPDGRVVVSAGLSSRVTHDLSPYDLRNLRLWAPRLLAFRRDVGLRLDPRLLLRQLRAASTISPRSVPVPSPEPRADPAQMDRALAAMAEVLPAMGRARIATYWSGLVDMTPDGLPVVDGDVGPAGLTLITGLCGHGLALGPVLGEIGADLALDGATRHPIDAFRLARFTEGPVGRPEKLV